MKKKFPLILTILFLWNGLSSQNLPSIQRMNTRHELIVKSKPFLILGGELGNSTATDLEAMRQIWPKLKSMNLNTVLIPVYWELMEPRENRFDFSLVDTCIQNARKNDLHIIFLWFGSWKNSMSSYAPEWVKTNTQRFPRAEDDQHNRQEILTPFNKNNLDADINAFENLMMHIKDVDSKTNTVIAIQVENEIGMLPSARSHDKYADEAYKKPVPGKLISYLKNHRKTLVNHLDSLWQVSNYKETGNWEELFGEGVATEELFTAWYFGVYVNEIARAGKKAYNLPMFVNAALNRPGHLPGQYPSGGPLPHLRDIWKAAAPDIDILAPDIYFPDFIHWANKFNLPDNPLLIPEIRLEKGVEAKALYAFGNYDCLGFSPFSIESANDELSHEISSSYQIIGQLTPLIIHGRKEGKVRGILLNKGTSSQEIQMGQYRLMVSHDWTLPWSPGNRDKDWPTSACIIIQSSADELYIGGSGIVVTFSTTETNKRTGLLKVEKGVFHSGNWEVQQDLNGDETHQGRHVRIPTDDWQIQKIRLYNY